MKRLDLLLALSVVACNRGDVPKAAGTADEGPARVEVGSRAPVYRAISLEGDSVSLGDQNGKVVLLNVWATWCHPCRDEIPELQKIHQTYRDRGLELIGVSVDGQGADAIIREFMKEFRMTYPIWRDPGERISTQFQIFGVPATFLIDTQGMIRWRKTGPVQPGDATLTAAIERALQPGT